MFISGAVNRYIEDILGGHGDFLKSKILNNQTKYKLEFFLLYFVALRIKFGDFL